MRVRHCFGRANSAECSVDVDSARSKQWHVTLSVTVGWHGVTTTVGSPCLFALPACSPAYRHESMPPSRPTHQTAVSHETRHQFFSMTFATLFARVLPYRTIRTSPSNWHLVSSSSIIDCTFAGLPPPDPAPMSGSAIDLYLRFCAIEMALRTESRIDRSDDRQIMLIPATWMID